MVRHVLMEVRKNQQQLEHAVALLGIRIRRAFLEILHNSKRIGEKPFEAFRVHRQSAAAAIQREVRSLERLIHKMIQAKLLAGERLRD